MKQASKPYFFELRVSEVDKKGIRTKQIFLWSGVNTTNAIKKLMDYIQSKL